MYIIYPTPHTHLMPLAPLAPSAAAPACSSWLGRSASLRGRFLFWTANKE